MAVTSGSFPAVGWLPQGFFQPDVAFGHQWVLPEHRRVGFSSSLLWAAKIPACLFPFLLARSGMSGWPGQLRHGLRAACGTTGPPS